MTLAGLLVLAIAIAAFAPATLVDARIDSMSGGALRVSDAHGTLWRGRGVLASPRGPWRVPVQWTLEPLPLLVGVTSIRLGLSDAATEGPRGRIELRDNRIVADSLVARIPATLVASLAAPATVQAGGDVDLRIESLTLAPTGSSGAIAAQWRNARLLGIGWPVIDLGTLTARLTVRGNSLAGPVSTRGGEVRVSGDVTIGADGVGADLRLTPEASAPAAVHKALASLGTPDASGTVALRVDRRMR